MYLDYFLSKKKNNMNTHFSSVESVIEDLLHNLPGEDKNKIGCMKQPDLIQLHFGLGTMILNQYGLWTDNRQLLDDCGVTDPDEASSVIIKKLWQILQSPTKNQ